MSTKSDKVVFPSRQPMKIISLIDDIVKKDGRFKTRTDAIIRALEEFFAEGFAELFEEYLYKQTSVRLPQEINVKLNVLYEKSDAVRTALIIFLLKHHYKVIPEEIIIQMKKR